ncbi:MAG: ubiquitin-like small modifier protein 1 [Acidimicrobiia bacterium]
MKSTARIRIPSQLRNLTSGLGEVDVEGETVGEALRNLEATYPGFGERLFDDGGQLRRFVNVFVADEDVRFLDGLDTPLGQGQTVSIVPAVAGG